jgi:uncharacterized protein
VGELFFRPVGAGLFPPSPPKPYGVGCILSPLRGYNNTSSAEGATNGVLANTTEESFFLIGIISDTHGLLRPEAMAALRGAEHIIHAGDVGEPEILDQLGEIALVTAVRGNIDKGTWARKLPETQVVELSGISMYVLHDLGTLDLKPQAAGFKVVISGHSHVPKQELRDGVLYFNPGSAGPRRFRLPVTVGRLFIENGGVRGEIVTIAD